jgi:hypothetical protein
VRRVKSTLLQVLKQETRQKEEDDDDDDDEQVVMIGRVQEATSNRPVQDEMREKDVLGVSHLHRLEVEPKSEKDKDKRRTKDDVVI